MPDLQCKKCTKGLSLTFTCKCGLDICIKHRFEHQCTIDYKFTAKEQLAKNNPIIVRDKVTKL